jgi:DNA uptake protein ComE-like DNA-binding protein
MNNSIVSSLRAPQGRSDRGRMPEGVPSPYKGEANHGGSVLMIALWSLFILASFAVMLGFQVRQKMVLVKHLESRNKLTAIAEAAIPLGIAEVGKFVEAQSFALKDSWSSNSMFKDIPVAGGICTFIRPLPEPPAADQVFAYGMVDEESKININKADMPLLVSLMKVVLGSDDVEAQGLAASLIDWRDADNDLSLPTGSAETSFYRNGKYPYEAKNAPFQILDEIRLVNGFNANVFEKLKNYITIYGSGRVNINTAGKAVLYAIGFSQMAVDKILAARAGKDGIAGTEDDFVFTGISDVGPEVTKNGGFSPEDLAAFNNVIDNRTTVISTAFMINSIGKAPGDKDNAQVSCVIDLKGRILAYRRQ